MKKFWQSPKYKRHQSRRAIAELRRKQKKRRGHRSQQQSLDTQKVTRTYYKNEGSYLHLYGPNCFSFTDNPEHTLKFFSDLEKRLAAGLPTYINLHDVKAISSDALMYLLALLDVSAQRNTRIKFRGNIPIKGPAQSAILASGFAHYVRGLPRDQQGDSDTLQIVSDSLVQPKVAHELLKFAQEKLELERGPSTRGAYAILIESMSNVVEHAYAESVEFERKWWAMAQCIDRGGSVRMTVVDYGEGIAATMRRSLIEQLGQTVGLKKDHSLVISAMKGEIRSRTGKESRGQG